MLIYIREKGCWFIFAIGFKLATKILLWKRQSRFFQTHTKIIDPRKNLDPRKNILYPRNPRKMLKHVKSILTRITQLTHITTQPTQISRL